jgi:hypothetical protein
MSKMRLASVPLVLGSRAARLAPLGAMGKNRGWRSC